MITRLEISSAEEKEDKYWEKRAFYCPRCEERKVIEEGTLCYICKEVIDE